MPETYASFKSSPKSLTTSGQIGSGQIDLSHLSPELFLEVRSIRLHNHSGTKSRKIKLQDLTGEFGIDGFYMYDVSGTRYHVTISGGAFVLTVA